jgi:hypothetical protein
MNDEGSGGLSDRYGLIARTVVGDDHLTEETCLAYAPPGFADTEPDAIFFVEAGHDNTDIDDALVSIIHHCGDSRTA